MNDQRPDGRATRIKAALGARARTPEELEVLFEDTLLLGDSQALAELFEAGAVFVVGDEPCARGGEAIVQYALTRWAGPHSYGAEPRRVIQARDMALIVAEHGLNVARRDREGSWRYVIIHCADEAGNERN